MRYTVHPLASGVLDARILATGLAVLCLVGAAVAAFFVAERGWLALAFLIPGSRCCSGTTPRPCR
jgi:1,4-dihydroxy-2-naphthoate octaprenyltransferase